MKVDKPKSECVTHGPLHPLHMLARLWGHRGLLGIMAKREVETRYKGSAGGFLWFVINNIALLAVYSFVFGVVFKARWQGAAGQAELADPGVAMPLFIGILVFNIFSETVMRAPSLVVANANFVKKVVFPLEVLAPVTLATALFNAGIGVIVLVTLGLVLGTPVAWTTIFLPLIVLPIALQAPGATWMLASLGVYLRDTQQIVGLCVTVLMFASPVFYPAAVLPAEWQTVLAANPLSLTIEQARAAVIFGQVPAVAPLCAMTLYGFLFAWLGWMWFERTRQGFADVL